MGGAYLWMDLACGLGLIVDWDDISEHFRRFRHSAISPCPLVGV